MCVDYKPETYVDQSLDEVLQSEAEDDMELPFAPDYDYTDSDYYADDDAADTETYLVTITAPKGGRRLTVTLGVDRY